MAAAPAGAAPAASAPDDLNLRDDLNRHERDLLMEAHRAVEAACGAEAARLLGIDPRNLAYYSASTASTPTP